MKDNLKEYHKAITVAFDRQNIVIGFLIDRLSIIEYRELDELIKKFDDDQKPESKKKREEELKETIQSLSKIAKPEPPKTRKEEPPE